MKLCFIKTYQILLDFDIHFFIEANENRNLTLFHMIVYQDVVID